MTVSARDQDQHQGLQQHRTAEDLRALAAEHRARAHELRASVNGAAGPEDAGNNAYLHAGIEERLAEVADLRAAAIDERAAGATARADELEREADGLSELGEGGAELNGALSEAAMERARVREQLRLAGAARRAAIARGVGVVAELHSARAENHEAWAELHARLALAHQLRGQGLDELAETSLREAEKLRSAALRAEELFVAAERQAGVWPSVAAEPSAGAESPA
jgi:hypothetical protein